MLQSDIILESLKINAPPWKSKYNRGCPTNPQTLNNFTGINSIILDAVADKHCYRSKYWATYIQWKKLGIQVEKNSSGTPIINWHEKKLNTHFVFNADQCFGATCGHYLILKENVVLPDYSKAQELVDKIGIEIFHEDIEHPKFERPPVNKITLPFRNKFIDDAQYWASVFHELIHWTEARLGWIGSEDQGELISEIATGYLESELMLPHDTDPANYDKWAQIWIQNIEKTPKYLMDAAAQSSRAVDYVLNFGLQQEFL